MNCQSSNEQISLLLDNELPKEFLQPLFRHLGECEECGEFFRQTKRIHDNVKNLGYAEVPESIGRKFEILGITEIQHPPLMARRFTISVSSAILSGVIICMMSLVFFAFISKSSSTQQFIDQQSVLNPDYLNIIQQTHSN